MLALGLFAKKKQATDGLSIKKNEWQLFLIECGIDTMQLHCTQVKEICKRKIHWISLGEYKCDKRYDVINQFDFYEDDHAETRRNQFTHSYVNEEQMGPKKLTSIITYNSGNGSNESNVNVQSTIRMLNRWYNDIATYVDKDGGKRDNETDNEEEEHSESNPESATTKDGVSERFLKIKETLSTLSKTFEESVGTCSAPETITIIFPVNDLQSIINVVNEFTAALGNITKWNNHSNEPDMQVERKCPILKRAGIPLRKSLLHDIIFSRSSPSAVKRRRNLYLAIRVTRGLSVHATLFLRLGMTIHLRSMHTL